MASNEERPVAIVTGAARGIGHAIAARLLRDRWRVVLVDRDGPAVHEVAVSLSPDSEDARAATADISDADEVGRVVDQTVATWGRIDALVNNAGITGPSIPLWEYDETDWRSVYAVNVDGTFLFCRAVVRHMLTAGRGHIVNVASISGKEGNPNMSAYSSSKAAVIGMTKALGKELAATGIIVNAVTPAVVETEILRGLPPETVRYMVNKIPMGRTGRPEEVANLVAWLCSDECSFSTGAVFDISGGRATY